MHEPVALVPPARVLERSPATPRSRSCVVAHRKPGVYGITQARGGVERAVVLDDHHVARAEALQRTPDPVVVAVDVDRDDVRLRRHAERGRTLPPPCPGLDRGVHRLHARIGRACQGARAQAKASVVGLQVERRASPAPGRGRPCCPRSPSWCPNSDERAVRADPDPAQDLGEHAVLAVLGEDPRTRTRSDRAGRTRRGSAGRARRARGRSRASGPSASAPSAPRHSGRRRVGGGPQAVQRALDHRRALFPQGGERAAATVSRLTIRPTRPSSQGWSRISIRMLQRTEPPTTPRSR